jgi:hypothetical protein
LARRCWLAVNCAVDIADFPARGCHPIGCRGVRHTDVSQRDEIGQLATDFNSLAHTLPARNEQMRREFMADVSHELRTPLGCCNGSWSMKTVHPRRRTSLRSLQAEVAPTVGLHRMTCRSRTGVHVPQDRTRCGRPTGHGLGFSASGFAARALRWNFVCLTAQRFGDETWRLSSCSTT